MGDTIYELIVSMNMLAIFGSFIYKLRFKNPIIITTYVHLHLHLRLP